MAAFDFDVLIIGSGFGGSVSALRLAEKGYRVGVLEAGRRFADADFAEDLVAAQGLPVGPTAGAHGHPAHPRAQGRRRARRCGCRRRLPRVREHPLRARASTSSTTRSGATSPTGPTSSRPTTTRPPACSGVIKNPHDDAQRRDHEGGRRRDGRGHTFTLTPVGVYFGEGPGVTRQDPFFGGVGPERTGCIECGECMTGCRFNAKNTLPKNYLALAEPAGAGVYPLTTVTGLSERAGWRVHRRHGAHRSAGHAPGPHPVAPSRSSWPPARTTPRSSCTA